MPMFDNSSKTETAVPQLYISNFVHILDWAFKLKY